MINIIKSIVAFGFILICGFILFTSKPVVADPIEIHIKPAEEAVVVSEVEKIIPVELSIESIYIKAPIEQVGFSNGAMGVPTEAGNAGWYEFGTVPGEVGSAVLAGHVNWKDSPNAVFTNLKSVEVGDIVTVTMSDDKNVSFVVTHIKSYPLYADANEVFSSNDGLSHLNLVTCDGVWNSIIHSHESRLVIFTEKIEEKNEMVIQ